MLVLLIVKFAISHITNPAGAATVIALPSTNIVLSMTDLTSIFPICGRRYGGSSSMNEDGMPFIIVEDNIFDTTSITVKLDNIVNVNIKDETKLDDVAKNMDIIAINSGKAQFSYYAFLRFLFDLLCLLLYKILFIFIQFSPSIIPL